MANNPPISSEVCRLCLMKDQDVYLGEKISKEKKYWQVMTSFTNIKYSPDDGLPQSICRMCASQLSNILIFKQRCEASNETLLANLSSDTQIEYLEEESIPELSTVIVKEEAIVTTDHQDEPVKVKSEEEEIEYSLKEDDLSEDEEVEVKKRVRKKGTRVPEKKHKCTECGVMWRTPDKLARHFRTHAFNKGRLYPCKHCSLTFLKIKHLRYHLSDKCKKLQKKKNSERQENSDEDAENEEALSDSDGFKCYVCSSSCKNLESLRSHLKTCHSKTGHLLMRCCGCSFIPETSNELLEHYRVSQACTDKANYGEIYGYTCDICGKVFRRKSILKLHSIMHSGEKRFECDICFKRFPRKDQIIVHKNAVHFDIRRFKCQDCGRAYRMSRYLKRHARIHTGEANYYECPICYKQFKCDLNCKVHMKSHTWMEKKET